MSELYGWDSRHVPMDGRVLLGSTVATLADWAQALSIPQSQVRTRMNRGDLVIQALRDWRDGRHAVPIRFEHDEGVRDFVRAHPMGATLTEVGDFFGMTRERVRQVQSDAVAKLERRTSPGWVEILGDAAGRQEGAA